MNQPTLQYGSVCSGIEAVSLAWQPLGWRPAWFAEIDPFPNAVLAHHYPTVPNLGDMTLIADQVRAGTVPAPDILVGGTPCQAFSVAGARQGLSDPRGALTLKYTELADAIDQTRQENDQPPTIVVWENVFGVLSDKSNAFGCFLGALAGAGRALEPAGRRWTNAGCVAGPRRRIVWRVLNAQYFGVAQRRRRVFLVASGRDDLDPAEVLFEPGSLHGDPEAGGEAWEGTAAASENGAGSPGSLAEELPLLYRTVTICFGGGNTSGPIDRAACLTARGHKCDFEVETFAAQSVAGSIHVDPKPFEGKVIARNDDAIIVQTGRTQFAVLDRRLTSADPDEGARVRVTPYIRRRFDGERADTPEVRTDYNRDGTPYTVKTIVLGTAPAKLPIPEPRCPELRDLIQQLEELPAPDGFRRITHMLVDAQARDFSWVDPFPDDIIRTPPAISFAVASAKFEGRVTIIYDRGGDWYVVELHRGTERIARREPIYFDSLGETLESLIDDGSWRQIQVEILANGRKQTRH